MSGHSREDEIILSLLNAGKVEDVHSALAGLENEDEQTLARLYTEVLGLTGLSTGRAAPRPALRARLLARVRTGALPTAAPAPAMAEVARLAPVPAVRPQRAGRRWVLPLAASLAVLAASGAAVSYYQQADVAERRVASLSDQLLLAQKAEISLKAEAEAARSELRFLAERFGMVTQAGVVACPLRPISGQRVQTGAAVLYILQGGKQWYLKAIGLPAAGPGQTYEFWFMTEHGPVSGGRFSAESPERAELVSSGMPGMVTGVLITLEPAIGSREPSGERVLFGNDKMQLL